MCAFGVNVFKLEKLLGKDLANQISEYRNQTPSIWTKELENYLEYALDQTGKQFKIAIQNEIKVESANKFRLYIEKVLMDFYNIVDLFPTHMRTIGERKFIVCHISALFKFYELSFGTLTFDWIESHSRAAKVNKSSTDSGIVKVDIKEVAGPPGNQIIDHTVGDTQKALHTDILNLVAILRNHLNIDVNIATQIKVFSTQVIKNRLTLYALSILEDGRFLAYELASADLPFDFNSRSKYKAILWMMAKFHDEMVEQMAILNKIDRLLIPCEGKTVRDVLIIPINLRNI